MKPFNLERALAGDPVVTRDGRKVIELKYFEKSETDHCVVALINNEGYIEGNFDPDTYKKNGKFWTDESESPNDLFMAPNTTTYWFNIYQYLVSSGDFNMSCAYKSYEEALSDKNRYCTNYHKHLKIISIEIEE